LGLASLEGDDVTLVHGALREVETAFGELRGQYLHERILSRAGSDLLVRKRLRAGDDLLEAALDLRGDLGGDALLFLELALLALGDLLPLLALAVELSLAS
jgi:hypothetical protein